MISDNRSYFDRSILYADKLFKQGDINNTLAYIANLSCFAWHNFTGRYSSGHVEKLLADLSDEIFKSSQVKIEPNKSGKRKILHILSEIHSSGGHSKLVDSWVNLDLDSDHSLVSIRQELEEVKQNTSVYNLSHVNMFSSYDKDYIKNAYNLKAIIEKGFDVVVLHIHPDEVIANIVLKQFENIIPILFLNHADHIFWNGMSVINGLIQIREVNIKLDIVRRNASIPQYFLPIPIDIISDESEGSSRNNKINILSIGSFFKYLPNKEYNFFEEICAIADRFKDKSLEVEFNIIGVSDSDISACYLRDNIHYLGVLTQDQLKTYILNSDLYLEGFPFPSFTALLQVSLHKVPFLLHYNPIDSFKLFDEDESHFIQYPSNVTSWRNSLLEYIENVELRSKVKILQYDKVAQIYNPDYWKRNLTNMYNSLESNDYKSISSYTNNFYETRNEIVLASQNNLKINHFSYCKNMSTLDKLSKVKDYFYFQNKVPLQKVKLRSILKYIFF